MPDHLPLRGAAALPFLGLIRARGADAAAFLQGQLTNDVVALDERSACLAGYCSAKGRLLASFIVLRLAAEEFLLVCSADLLAPTLKRLAMFVLRARCKLDDASADYRLYGLAGMPELAGAPLESWRHAASGSARVLRLPDAAGVARQLCIAPAEAAPPELPPLSADAWRWLDVQSGVASIEAATVERFVPQMLNLELVGGVSFQKGCYPGQEIVARSQYRGTIKRRMALFDLDGAARAGQEVYHDGDAAQPAGMVVNAAPAPDGGGSSSALVEVKLATLDAGSLHLGDPAGTLLRPRPLPYPVPREAAL